jgi:hypothetical protein
METKMNVKYLILMVIGVFLMAGAGQAEAFTDFVYLGDYIIEYQYEEADVEAGERFSIVIFITNEGNDDKVDVNFELSERSPFDIVGDDDFEIGNMSSDDVKSKRYRLVVSETAMDGNYDIEFKIEDEDDEYEDFIEVEVESNIPEIIVGNINSLPTLITPDSEDVKLILTLENIGDDDAEFVRVKLSLPNGLKASNSFSDIANIGILKEGESKEVTFFVDTDEFLSSGNYKGALYVDYEDEDGDAKKVVLDFDIPVKGRPQFEVIGSLLRHGTLYAGDEGEVEIVVLNSGAEEGVETSVRIFENSDQPFEYSEKTKFVGTLDKGESGKAIFGFEIDKDAQANTYSVKIQIRTVSEDNVLVSEETIPIKISEEQRKGSNNGFLMILPIILFLVLVILLYLIYRRN